MVEDRIGYRYAKSIFDLAKERKSLDTVQKDMEVIRDLVQDNPDFARLLNSPLVPSLKKRTIIGKVMEGRLESELSQKLVDIIAVKGRERYIPFMAQAYLDLYDKENRILRGVLTSARPLHENIVEEIKQKIEAETGNTLTLEQEIDPELLGGFVLQVGDQLFDGSVAASLRKMRRQFEE